MLRFSRVTPQGTEGASVRSPQAESQDGWGSRGRRGKKDPTVLTGQTTGTVGSLGCWAFGVSAQGLLAPSRHLSHLLQLDQATTLIYNNKKEHYKLMLLSRPGESQMQNFHFPRLSVAQQAS